MLRILMAFLILGTTLIRAETIITSKVVDAFDLQTPSKLIGHFQANSYLEVMEFVEGVKMFKVTYKPEGAGEIVALVKPGDIGRSIPENKPASTHAQPVSAVKSRSVYDQIESFDPAVWDWTPERFIQSHKGLEFKWVEYEEDKTCESPKTHSFLEKDIPITTVRFDEGKIQSVTLVLEHGSADEPVFDEKGFNAYYPTIAGKLDVWTQFKAVDAYVKFTRGFIKRKSWFKKPFRIDLEWGSRQPDHEIKNRNIKIEFVRLYLTPYDGSQSIIAMTSEAFQKKKDKPVGLATLVNNIQMSTNGDVYIDHIPMVQMGENDYSVTSTGDRILRYYKIYMDPDDVKAQGEIGLQNDISPEDMYRTLKKMGDDAGLSVRELKQTTFQTLSQEIREYNPLTKPLQLSVINIPKLAVKNLNNFMNRLEPFLFRQVRLKDRSQVNRFESMVKDHVKKGIPLSWLVYLSWVDESKAAPPNAKRPGSRHGPHLRLIMGYNEQTKEILYTDPWGSGHGMKRMSLDDAYFMTNGLYAVMPPS